MKKAVLVLTVVIVLAVAAGAYLHSVRSRPVWTTDSPEALAELEKGLDARMKFYGEDAVRHFRRALEFDPDFVAPRLMLLEVSSDAEAQPLLAELGTVDAGLLSPRERFLLQYRLTRLAGRSQDAQEVLDRFLDRHPDDPFALAQSAMVAQQQNDTEAAETYYRRLLEVEPNWVLAQNWLGYLAMRQGQFEEAEKHFKTYQYIASDQPNPHDSMGELLILTGRYDEARQELERALALRPNFGAAYFHLIWLFMLEGDVAQAERAQERAEEELQESGEATRCLLDLLRGLAAGDWQASFTTTEGCDRRSLPFFVLRHRAAVVTGRLEIAEAMEKGLEQALAERKREPISFWPLIRGTRLLAQGKTSEAMAQLREADGILTFYQLEEALFKLISRHDLATALESQGQAAEAAALRQSIYEVNPAFPAIDQHLEVPVPAAADAP